MGFYISISNGLLDGDHELRMGPAVWQYMWLIDKVTMIDEKGLGWVLGGKPVRLEDFGENRSRDTVSRNLNRLKDEGYIGIEYAPNGMKICVTKAKKRFGKNVEPGSAKMSTGFGKNVEPNRGKTIQDNSTKTAAEVEKLWTRFEGNPLMAELKRKYPDRDYRLQFGLMCDWYLTKKKRLPKNISALANWVKNPWSVDEEARAARLRAAGADDTKQRLAALEGKPVAPERVRELMSRRGEIGRLVGFKYKSDNDAERQAVLLPPQSMD